MHLGPTSTCRSHPLNVLPCNLIPSSSHAAGSRLHVILSKNENAGAPLTHRHTCDFPTSILTKRSGDADPLFSQDWTY
ncbi:hypothetical protein BofuT4_uP033800.1 [Botrytis cinerea T4]|nr:hypothetical protein BofuT4_uP033800.1 [Botrytis cinerea T4]